jgi:hypothetical protein
VQRLRRAGIGEVGDQRDDRHARRELGGERVEAFLAARSEHERLAARGVGAGDVGADAAGCAGDQR